MNHAALVYFTTFDLIEVLWFHPIVSEIKLRRKETVSNFTYPRENKPVIK